MTETDTRRARIKDKIAASQERLRRGTPGTPALPAKSGPSQPDSPLAAMGQHPLLTLAGGLAVGVVIGALVPRSASRKLGSRAMTLAAMAGDIGLALARQARSRAHDVGEDAAARIEDLSDSASESAAMIGKRARKAAGRARSTGLHLAGEALKLAARARR